MFDVSEYFNNKGVLNWRQVGSHNLIFTTFFRGFLLQPWPNNVPHIIPVGPHIYGWYMLIWDYMGYIYIYMLIYVGYIMVDICWYTIPQSPVMDFTCQVAWGDAPEAAEAPPLGQLWESWTSQRLTGTKLRPIRHRFPPNVCPAAKDLRSSSNRKFQGLLVVGGEWLPSILFSHEI